MKNKILSLFTFLLVTGVFTSCDNGDDVDGIVQVNKPTMTIDFPTAVTVSEGDAIPFTVNLSAPVGHEFSLFIVLDQQGSTAGDLDSDVENSTTNVTYQKVITIPPFVTTYSDVINIYNDDVSEGSETLKLIVGDSRTSAVNFEPVVSTVTINNVVSDELVLGFHFDKTFSGSAGYSNSLCEITRAGSTPVEHYDIDFLLWDDNFVDTNNTTAQTGACDEVMTIDINDLDVDPLTGIGVYHVIANLFSNGGLNQILASPVVDVEDFDIPITVDYMRSGSIDTGTFTQEDTNWFKASTAVGDLQQVVDIKVTEVAGVRKVSIMNTLDTTIFATGKIKNKGKYISKHKK